MHTKSVIQAMFEAKGASEYGGESVTQLEHALQAAMLAEQSNSTPQLVLAALLHDIGHLLHDLPEDAPALGIDDHHENSGYAFLIRHFSSAVTEPVRQHVAAKRYLCAVDREYLDQLSDPSRTSLALQGGPMNDAEVKEFEANPFFQDSILLRRWDDQAKLVDCETPSLNHFLDLIDQLQMSSSNCLEN